MNMIHALAAVFLGGAAYLMIIYSRGKGQRSGKMHV